MPKALPPTADGVMAEVNSHSSVTFSVFHHDSLRSVMARKRHAMPKSLPAMARTAKKRLKTTHGVKCISENVDALNSP